MRNLALDENELSGQIPEFNSPNLERLYLNNNELSGKIPTLNLPNLKILWLHNNDLAGEVPDLNLNKLERLRLHGNTDLNLSNTELNLESLKFYDFEFSRQRTLLPLKKNGNILSVIDDCKYCEYQWYKSETAIPDENGESFNYKTSGNYWCEVWSPLAPEVIFYSDTVQVDVENVQKQKSKYEFLYSNNRIEVISRISAPFDVKIYDLNGREIIVSEENYSRSIFDLSEFLSGVYLVRISDSKQTISKKIIVSH